jgi:hypothetical protein
MAITKNILIDQITVTDTGHVMLREVTKILENGKELNKTYHRTTIEPNSNVSKYPENVRNICAAVWV